MAAAGIAAGLIQRPLHPLQHCTTLKFQLGSPTLESGEQENSHMEGTSQAQTALHFVEVCVEKV